MVSHWSFVTIRGTLVEDEDEDISDNKDCMRPASNSEDDMFAEPCCVWYRQGTRGEYSSIVVDFLV
jgi:hypothetical protein